MGNHWAAGVSQNAGVLVGSDNGSLPVWHHPIIMLYELMQACSLDSLQHIFMKFESKYKYINTNTKKINFENVFC